MYTSTQPRGFVALMSVTIISAVLLVFVFGLGAVSFFARFDALDSEHKRISLSLAESCVSAALLKIAQDPAYTPAPAGDQITIQTGKTCKICPGTTNSIIVTRAVHNSAYSNIRASVAVSNGTYTITSWREEAQGPSACTLP